MRRWIALLTAIAALAMAGTALAMTGPSEEPVTTTTPEVEATTSTTGETSTTEEPAEPETVVGDGVEVDPMVWEEPDEYVPYEPGDHNPPTVEILYPEDDHVFDTHEVVFEGTTEPGAMVFLGERQADVRDDGSWRIVLDLDEGENHVTAKAIDEAGNDASDSVTVLVDIPDEPEAEEPKTEEPKTEEPKTEEPKTEEPREEEPKEDEVDWEFSAHQTYGECSENPPYDVFHGTGRPGTTIVVEAEYARKTTEVNQHGEWETKVVFEGAPVGESFQVWVVDSSGHERIFEFVHTD
jgi:hypothetical protein